MNIPAPNMLCQEVFMPIPNIGDPMPPLEVVDNTGAPVTLQALSGSSGLVLLFYRGAW
jgi:peroxiredoxin